jgi:hypothetical protein
MCHFTTRVLALSVLTSCAAAPDDGWRVEDPRLEPAVAEAMQLWRDATDEAYFPFISPGSRHSIRIVGYGPGCAYHDLNWRLDGDRHQISIRLPAIADDDKCALYHPDPEGWHRHGGVRWSRCTPYEVLVRDLAHELGHGAGLHDAPGTERLMDPGTSYWWGITDEDVAGLRK